MIFVTVGTHEQPFNRLVEYVDQLKKEKIIEVVYRNILFKCIYLWWRLYDRIFDEEEVCE